MYGQQRALGDARAGRLHLYRRERVYKTDWECRYRGAKHSLSIRVSRSHEVYQK